MTNYTTQVLIRMVHLLEKVKISFRVLWEADRAHVLSLQVLITERSQVMRA